MDLKLAPPPGRCGRGTHAVHICSLWDKSVPSKALVYSGLSGIARTASYIKSLVSETPITVILDENQIPVVLKAVDWFSGTDHLERAWLLYRYTHCTSRVLGTDG